MRMFCIAMAIASASAIAEPASAQSASVIIYRTGPDGWLDDVYLGDYADRGSLLSGSGAFTLASWQLDDSFAIGGLSWTDGGALSALFYRMSPGGWLDDVYLAEYADRDAFLTDTGTFTLANWQLDERFAIGGFDFANLRQPNFGAVPEPASWSLLIAGFGLVGLAARRRRLAAS